PREAPDPLGEAALAAPQVRGFRHWLRVPTWRVQRLGEGWRVVLMDVRYSRLRGTRLGIATVTLDGALRPSSSP
ncbi:MAG: metal-dependent hydrolase, partial [Archangium sp.]